MKTTGVFNLEELLDKNKFASVDVAIRYGDLLLKDIDKISKYVSSIWTASNKLNFSEHVKKDLNDIIHELSMMKISVNDMKNFLTGYKPKIEPSKEIEEEFEDRGITEEELKNINLEDYKAKDEDILKEYKPKYKSEE